MNEENKIRINFKGGLLNGLSTLANEPYIIYEGLMATDTSEIYKLEVTDKTLSHLRYKFIGKARLVIAVDIQA